MLLHVHACMCVWAQCPKDLRMCVCVCVGVGHCPQDEAPELVNPLIHKFCTTHT